MPTFWLGLMLIIFLSVLPKLWHVQNHWDWLPYMPSGYISHPGQDDNVLNRIYYLALPVAMLSFVNIASFARFVRSSMLEVLRQDYMRTAWAKGLSQRMVILRYALRNAMLPVITIVTLSLPGLVAGAIVTETVFSYAGMGKLFANAVFQMDLPILMAFLMLSTTAIVTANILASLRSEPVVRGCRPEDSFGVSRGQGLVASLIPNAFEKAANRELGKIRLGDTPAAQRAPAGREASAPLFAAVARRLGIRTNTDHWPLVNWLASLPHQPQAQGYQQRARDALEPALHVGPRQ